MALPPIAAPGDWSRVIADAALLFMNTQIQIVSTSTTPYDMATSAGGDTVVTVHWSGQARGQNLANTRGFNVGGESTGNPTGTRGYTWQVPLPEDGGPSMKIQRGWFVKWISGGNDDVLDESLFLIDSVLNSTWRATQLLICTVDVEATPGWSA